ncbi:hypothetical protein EYB33_06365 [Lysinibacillus sphaericus]|uniref:DUF4052 domain-containing protein n=1 Tax=Lysinibacillus tabacifolii TaxID=1173107 RepID=A0ABY2SYB7_9BACI|nr:MULTISPECIES: hypothetical protein [Lysinibacillus]MCS1380960.1 hypothetical protein [Lysinibacillus sphaericus]TKI48282.1 hypothetical protein FC748_11700 [Lysinibacillus tabacifolii]UDK95931.1 hypothetical protein EYB33_06365 [Lysinibacillus sphaericus]
MKTVQGSLYVFFQSYKKSNIIFWCILFAIVLLSFFIDSFFGQYITFAMTISIPVYIFYSTMGAKILNKTLPYFLKLGLSRMQYVWNVGLFFIVWSLIGAFIIACTHKMISFVSNLLDYQNMVIIHPLFFFSSSDSFFLTMAIDTVLLLLCLISSLLLNVVFYRFGTLGGYSFIGVMALIPIMMVIFGWYSPLLLTLSKASTLQIISSLLGMIIIIYIVISSALRKAPAMPS